MASALRPKHLGRYASIGALLLKHRGEVTVPDDPGAPTAEVDGDVGSASADDARQLVDDLESMGPTFVKLGQLLSTRADLLPPVYLEALSRLQDDVAPFPFEQVEEIVEAEVGARISRAFTSFDHQPMASASLGQVHRAVLRDGRPVAVKVQRPGIRRKVVEDMEVIEELAAFVDEHTRTGDRLRFAAMASEFRRSLMAELDYRREADNLRLLGQQLAAHDRIVVPQPIDDYSSGTVLTMELVEGRNVGGLGPLAQMELDGRPLAEQLFRAYLDQILVHGFVHADPHPGNVLLTDDGDLALIDLGMVVRVAPELQDQLLRLLASVSEGQGAAAAEVLVGMGTKGPEFDADGYQQAVARLVSGHQHATVGQIQAGAIVGELARAAASCGLRPPVEMTLIGKALLNLDQVAQILDPEFDPNEAIRQHTTEILRDNLLGSASPANLLHAAMDAREFANRFPGRVNKVMDALAEGEMTLNVRGIDEAELMRGIQKLANRVTAGLVIAALIVGAAMVMRIETDAELFGYPALAVVLFLVASLLGLGLVATSLWNDLPQRRRRDRSR
jgi:predicted unusual protein kinase regulating ubiquinone biosynthesis (AarF/ABC1/UbiB family)